MLIPLLNRLSTLVDIVALITVTGSLFLGLWIPELNRKDNRDPFFTIAGRLRKLIGACILLLIFSSIILLAFRTVEMSGETLTVAFTFIPVLLLKTHYGSLWFVRAVSLLVMCAIWFIGKNKYDQRKYYLAMFIAASIIAATRSATGHAADSGDFTIPEYFDWIHLMSVSVWAGCLIAITTSVIPVVVKKTEWSKEVIPKIGLKFTNIAFVSVLMIVVSGLYNAWYEVGSFHALINTSYGRFVAAKIIFLIVLLTLGALNRYSIIPTLRNREGDLYRSTRSKNPKGDSWIDVVCYRLIRNIRTETILVLIIIICTAFLLYEIPPRHLSGHITQYVHTIQNLN